MFHTSRLQTLRKRHYALEALPDLIRIPAIGARQEIQAKPIEDATLDDLAFAVAAVEAEFNAAANRLHAIRKLYSVARQAGALGSDNAVNAAYTHAGDR